MIEYYAPGPKLHESDDKVQVSLANDKWNL